MSARGNWRPDPPSPRLRRGKQSSPRDESVQMADGPLQDQCPMIRTEGSLTKAPTVVNRPVESISRRSMFRIGETVVVPTGCNRTRCGISEPVTKTVTSFGCSRRTVTSLTGLPASRVPPNIVTATRIIKLGDNIVFTSNTTSTIALCKFSSRPFSILSAAPDRGAKAPPTFHPPARKGARGMSHCPSGDSF